MRINAYTFTKLVGLLIEGTQTMYELAEATGLHYVTVQNYCREMLRQKVIHIAAYVDSGRDAKRVYKLGKGENARRRRKSRAAISRDYKARIRAKKSLPIERIWTEVRV